VTIAWYPLSMTELAAAIQTFMGRRHYLQVLPYALALVLLFSMMSRLASAQLIEKLADGRVRPSSVHGEWVAYLPIVFPSSHSSNLLSLRNGDLLCTYYSGRWEGGAGVAIVISRLAKGSNQWTKPEVVAEEAGSALENPVLFEPSAGLLWLFYTSQAADAGQSSAQVIYRTSQDNGKSWSGAKVLFAKPGSFDRQPLVVSDDQWLFPMYYTPPSDADHYSAIRISTDQGHNWKECVMPNSNGLVQPDLVEVSPRRFLVFFRSRFADWIYTSSSEDGCSWTTPKTTQIPNNNSSIQAARLRNRHLVIAFNNIQATTTRGKPTDYARFPLSVALSIDGGQTWPWVRDVDIGQDVPQEKIPNTMAGVDVSDEQKTFFQHLFDYSYPSIMQTPDGLIHMSYTFRRRTIKYATFDEDWIKNGGTLGIFTGDRNHAE
jgi:predicted neuraminidase